MVSTLNYKQVKGDIMSKTTPKVVKSTKAKATASKDTQVVAKLVIPTTKQGYTKPPVAKKTVAKKKPVVKKDLATKVTESLKSDSKEEPVKSTSVLTKDTKFVDSKVKPIPQAKLTKVSEELKQQEAKVEISDKDTNNPLIKDETKHIKPKLMSVKDLFEGMRKVQNLFLHK